MKRYFRIKNCLLLLLFCLPFSSFAQTDSSQVIEEESRQLNSATMGVEAGDTTGANQVTIDDPEAYEEEQVFYEMRHISDSLVKDLKANKKLQYHDIKVVPPKRNTGFERFLMALFRSIAAIRIVIMLLLLAGLGFLVYWYMKTNGMSFFRKPKLIEGLTDVQEEELQSATAYQEKIKAAIAAGDTRMAIRWWYLYTLFQLAGREMIVAGREKTNNDYLRSMRSSPYYKKFATLTLDYEYIWYGGFEVSEDNFRSINQEFRDFNNAIAKAS